MKRLKKFSRDKELLSTLPQNEYYESVSSGLGIVQVVLYLSLLAFVVLSFLRNTDLITYRNFYYFIKDLNASAKTVNVWNTDSVSYPTDDKQSFALYRKGLAVAGNNSVTVFTATGRQSISQSISYRNPVAVGTGKYLLVYDLGGTEYSLYNSYTQIFSGETDYPISGAAVSESGTYALITEASEINSVVTLYNSSFERKSAYPKKGYVMDVAISSDGEQIAMVTSTVANGSFHTELTVCKVGEKTERAKLKISDSLALSCIFTEKNTVSVLCSGGVYTFTADGKRLGSHGFGGDTVAAYAITDSGIAVALKTLGTSEKKHILVFDKRGELICNENAPKQVDAMVRQGDTVYLQTAYSVIKLDVNTRKFTERICQTAQRKILAVSESEILLCSPQKAVYLNFDS